MIYPYFPFKLEASDNVEHKKITTSDGRLIHLNVSALEVLELCNGSLSIEGIVTILARRHGESNGQVVRAVEKLLGGLKEEKLIWNRQEKMRWFSPPAPQSIFWEFTSECNLRCLHCVVSAGKKNETELDTDEGLRLIQEWATLGVQDITFSGGEPLMRSDFFELATSVVDHGMMAQLATNGTLITIQNAERIKELGISPQVSLDGSNREVYSSFRGSQEAFNKAVSGITILVDNEVDVTIGTVLSKHNISDIDDMLDLVAQLGVKSFRLIPFIPSGRGKQNRKLELKPDQMLEVTKYLAQKRNQVPFEILPMEFELTLQPPSALSLDLTKPNECGGAVYYCTVTPSGEVLPCHYFFGVKADTLLEKPFSWIWSRSRFLNYFRSIRIGEIEGKCCNCKWLADCRGGCRAANMSNGEIFGQNNHCWVEDDNKKDTAREPL